MGIHRFLITEARRKTAAASAVFCYRGDKAVGQDVTMTAGDQVDRTAFV